MSEVIDRIETELPTVSAGTLLRRAREAAGLHMAALAVSLKVPVRKLEALEEDRYDLLPDAVFARGLASSICRSLKIDPRPVLERLPQSAAPQLVRNLDGLRTPFRAPSDGAPPRWIDYVRQPVFLAVFALLLGAIVLILLPTAGQGNKPESAAATAQPVTTTDPVLQQLAAMPPEVSSNETATAASGNLSSAAVLSTGSTAAPSTVAPVPAAVAKPAASAAIDSPAAATAAAAVAPAATGLLVIRARGDTWVDIVDAKGTVALRKTLVAGESAQASGALPLQVTIGRVDVTDVQVRGTPFDMRSVSRDNVARFEVK